MNKSSWQPVHAWYDKQLGNSGDWTHKNIITPKTVALLSLSPSSTLLDLGCGQGIFARAIPTSLRYMGVDISSSMIDSAKKRDKNSLHSYSIGDITTTLPFPIKFTHAVSILTLDNIQDIPAVIQKTATYLEPHGVFVFVINHPCFRIPRQSSWEIDEQNKIQYRRINRYLSPLEIPISMHPGETKKTTTWTFHYPLSSYSTWLEKSGFGIEKIEEWISDKTSVGTAAKMENRARAEIPLFLAVRAKKL